MSEMIISSTEDVFMAHTIEKRRCRRFRIPGMEIRFKEKGLLFSLQKFSKPYPVIDISKGGLSFICVKTFAIGKKLVVKLQIPGETSFVLDSVVRRQQRMIGSNEKITGVEFMPFGSRRGLNSPESLDVLRRLDKKYA